MSRIFHIGVDLQPKVGILGAVWPAESEDKVLGTDSGSFPDTWRVSVKSEPCVVGLDLYLLW